MRQLDLFDETKLALPQDAHTVVSISGGKDSVATLLVALETFGPGRVIAHHQIILEDWSGTIEYCQSVCNRLGVPLYMSQAKYHGYECLQCGYCYLTSRNVQRCPKCQSTEATFLRMVESVLDLVEWREKWPDLSVRFCTSYFKRDNFNMWAREHRELLGDHPVIAMGERALESAGRAKLPVLRLRSKMEWMIEWRPVLEWRRIDVFRKMREYHIEPHYCYKAQGMTEDEMYNQDREGGPRMSCVMCFLKSPEQMQASYQTPEGRPIIDRALGIEAATGNTLKNGQSLASMILQYPHADRSQYVGPALAVSTSIGRDGSNV
jgi:3'-phosphoadenosine 5'-phosphosulfate sulfotransferase (PAPS reductase)/FAD synthetase